jgi:hypothetical protein
MEMLDMNEEPKLIETDKYLEELRRWFEALGDCV